MDKHTIKQIQQLLLALGNSPGAIDGIWGNNSQAALMATLKEYDISFDTLVETTLPNLQPVSTGIPAFWKDIKHFSRSEFRCTCGKCSGYPAEPKEKLVRLEEKVRNHFNRPATNSSGVRCAAHNAEVGGVANSRHLTGCAVDFCIAGTPSSTTLAYVLSQPETAYAYAIDESYVHMDVII